MSEANVCSIGGGISAEPVEPTPSVFEKPDLRVVSDLESTPEPTPGTPDWVAHMRAEFANAVHDVELRLAQEYELRARRETGIADRVYVEDIYDTEHRLTGYLLNNNSPSAGSIAWVDLHIVFMGVDYDIANGNTANRYVWFIKPASGTTATLQSGNTLPTLTPNDTLVFVNQNGVAKPANSSLPPAIDKNTVTDEMVSSISQGKITGLAQAFTDLYGSIDSVVAIAEGAITQHFGPNFPWANGSTQPTSAIGDVYTAQNSTDTTARPNGASWRWSGAAGSPANTWVLIEDSAVTKALADAASALGVANGKSTTFYANAANTPSATAIGDQWIVLDQNNKQRRATAVGTGGWTDVLLGDAALSGISGSKVGTGINGSNVTTGTVAGARIGSGINGANLTAGTVGNGQLANNAVQPKNINAAWHLLY